MKIASKSRQCSRSSGGAIRITDFRVTRTCGVGRCEPCSQDVEFWPSGQLMYLTLRPRSTRSPAMPDGSRSTTVFVCRNGLMCPTCCRALNGQGAIDTYSQALTHHSACLSSQRSHRLCLYWLRDFWRLKAEKVTQAQAGAPLGLTVCQVKRQGRAIRLEAPKHSVPSGAASQALFSWSPRLSIAVPTDEPRITADHLQARHHHVRP
jgi:hypothetical protein